MRPVRKVEAESLGAGLWSCGCAEQEAHQLVGLLGKNGDTVESLRELIAVPLFLWPVLEERNSRAISLRIEFGEGGLTSPTSLRNHLDHYDAYPQTLNAHR